MRNRNLRRLHCPMVARVKKLEVKTEKAEKMAKEAKKEEKATNQTSFKTGVAEGGCKCPSITIAGSAHVNQCAKEVATGTALQGRVASERHPVHRTTTAGAVPETMIEGTTRTTAPEDTIQCVSGTLTTAVSATQVARAVATGTALRDIDASILQATGCGEVATLLVTLVRLKQSRPAGERKRLRVDTIIKRPKTERGSNN